MTGTAPVCAPAARRIGVYGGAFDPPHRAHRALAEAALKSVAEGRVVRLSEVL